MINYLHFIEKD